MALLKHFLFEKILMHKTKALFNECKIRRGCRLKSSLRRLPVVHYHYLAIRTYYFTALLCLRFLFSPDKYVIQKERIKWLPTHTRLSLQMVLLFARSSSLWYATMCFIHFCFSLRALLHTVFLQQLHSNVNYELYTLTA